MLAQLYYLLRADYSHLSRHRAIAVSICHQLGLHQSQKSNMTALEAETRKKTFWSQYVLDKYVILTCLRSQLLTANLDLPRRRRGRQRFFEKQILARNIRKTSTTKTSPRKVFHQHSLGNLPRYPARSLSLKHHGSLPKCSKIFTQPQQRTNYLSKGSVPYPTSLKRGRTIFRLIFGYGFRMTSRRLGSSAADRLCW